MDSNRGSNTTLPPPRPSNHGDAPEQLLDVFKAAALSVTKLFKTSAVAQSKARLEGYQDCLDDLLACLDREKIGLNDGEGWKIRRWATERLDGRDPIPQPVDSEDENDKADRGSDLPRLTLARQTTPPRPDLPVRVDHAVYPLGAVNEEPSPPHIDTFTFQAPHPYPNIANLDLSDAKSLEALPMSALSHATNHTISNRMQRQKHSGGSGRLSGRSTTNLGRGAGLKRRLNYAEIFDLGSLGKESILGSAKRTRLT